MSSHNLPTQAAELSELDLERVASGKDADGRIVGGGDNFHEDRGPSGRR